MRRGDAAAATHLARASHLASTARLDLLIGAAVAVAGAIEMAVALLFVRGHDLLGWLLRVHLLGLLGLFAAVWGAAVLDRAWDRLRSAEAAQRAILAGQPGWARALARLEE